MLVPGEPELLQKLQTELRKEFGERAVIFVSKPYFLEILPPACGKGEAVDWLANHISEKTGKQILTMGFGDSMNDESLIRRATWGVAMCNGLKEIQNIADYVTPKDNNHNGIADFLKTMVL